MAVEVTVTHEIKVYGGKEYPTAITRQHGLQEIRIGGEMVLVEDVTITESALGRSVCSTRARNLTPEGWESIRKRTQEIAAKAMIDMGIW